MMHVLPAIPDEERLMDLLDRHRQAMAEFDGRVREIGQDRWHDPTPCSDWDVRALVNHLVVEQLWVPDLLAGATLEDVGDRYDGDQLGDDPVGVWEQTSEAAREAIVAPGALDGEVHTSAGRISADAFVAELTLDLAVHAWDLARAIGGDERLDDELVGDLYEQVEEHAEAIAASGMFAAPRPTAPTADLQTRLLALLGRSR